MNFDLLILSGRTIDNMFSRYRRDLNRYGQADLSGNNLVKDSCQICDFDCAPGLIQREDGSMEKELEELRRSRPKPSVGGDFTLSDCFYFTRRGIESIVEDEVHSYSVVRSRIPYASSYMWFVMKRFLNSGDPEVLLRGARVLESVDTHQQRLPVHQSEADAGLRHRHLCEILHPGPAQVKTSCRLQTLK